MTDPWPFDPPAPLRNTTLPVVSDGRRALILVDTCPDMHPDPPPVPVSLVKAHYCDDPYHCCPF